MHTWTVPVYEEGGEILQLLVPSMQRKDDKWRVSVPLFLRCRVFPVHDPEVNWHIHRHDGDDEGEEHGQDFKKEVDQLVI